MNHVVRFRKKERRERQKTKTEFNGNDPYEASSSLRGKSGFIPRFPEHQQVFGIEQIESRMEEIPVLAMNKIGHPLLAGAQQGMK